MLLSGAYGRGPLSGYNVSGADRFAFSRSACSLLHLGPPFVTGLPSELARQMRMSRQATNYLIGQPEGLGYLERRAAADGERRLVYLTERGWKVADTIYASLRQLQERWADEVGRERFNDFMDVLRLLSTEDQPSSRQPSPSRPHCSVQEA